MVRSLLILLVMVATGFWSLQLGWPWIIFLVPAALAVCMFLLLRGSPGRERPAIYGGLFVMQALALAWLFRWGLGRVHEVFSEGTAARFIHVFAGTALLQNFWGLLLGMGGTLVLFALLLGPVRLLRLLPDSQVMGVSKFDAFMLGLRRALGWVPAEWEIRNGEIVTLRAAPPPYPVLTGPGAIEVQRDHVVIVERSGRIARFIEEGSHWLGAMERICMVVPLFGRGEAVVVRNASTSDPLVIEELNLAVFHKVNPPQFKGISAQELKKNLDMFLTNKVWSPSGNSWGTAVRAITEREARNAIADYDLETFLKLNGEGRTEFKKKLGNLVNKVTDEFLGVTVTITGIGAVTIPDLAAQRLMQRWVADKDQKFAWEQADLQRDIDFHVAEGRGEALKKMSDAMREARSYHTSPNDLLMLSMIEQIQRSGNTATSATGQEMDMVTRLLMMELLRNMGNRGAGPDSLS
ncbi:MAG: SPFH domain-containing protein [Caldilineales bacterium]